MERSKCDYWWLLALEAVLFFSIPCWELVAPYAEPTQNPFRFGACVVAAATAAMFACHLGPAAFAARFGGCRNRVSWLLVLWLGAGYLEWIVSAALTVKTAAPSFVPEVRSSDWHGSWSLGVAAAFLVTVFIAAWVKSWWKPVAIGALLLGCGILVWALATTWQGLWVRNPHYSSEPLQFDWLIVRGILVSTAPAVVIGWRVGRIEPNPNRIWLSGLAGVWLPLVISVTMASLANQAGTNLYWVPSLLRGFSWALLGPRGQLLQVVMVLAFLTLLGPALLSVVSLRELVSQWTRRQKMWLIPVLICLSVCGVTSLYWPSDEPKLSYATPAHLIWAFSLVFLGAVAGLTCLVSRMRGRSG